MINILRLIFSLILITMLVVTGWATMHENILHIPSIVTGDPWFIATMFDAYFGFTTFFIWVCYKEKSMPVRFLWFFLIMLLGNTAMASYVLLKMRKLKSDAKISELLLR